MPSTRFGGNRPTEDEFRRIVGSLNDNYDLHIQGPDPVLSPSKNRLQGKNEDQRLSEEIYELLRNLHYKGELSKKIDQFTFEADTISRRWVDEPLADPTTTLERSAPHGACSAGGRSVLRIGLRDILRESSRVKRLSDGHEHPSSKRTRSCLGDGPKGDSIDLIPFRSVQCPAPRQVFSVQNNPAASSRVSLSSTIFSEIVAIDATTGSSHATNGKSSQDYDPCTQELEALQESFSNLEGPPSDGSNDRTTDRMDVDGAAETRDALETLTILSKQRDDVWPRLLNESFNEAPLTVIWEITRAAIHCKVDLPSFDMTYDPKDTRWRDQKCFRDFLSEHRLFLGRVLPAPCEAQAWMAGLDGFKSQNNMVVVLSMELVKVGHPEGGLSLEAKLNPLHLRLGHRFDRRFGSDRFLEVTMPSLKAVADKADRIISWLCSNLHFFLGRSWVTFYTRSTKKSVKDPADSKKTRDIYQEQMYFFATNGNNFCDSDNVLPVPEEASDTMRRTKVSYSDLLQWAIGLTATAREPVLKLFSRLALSLSRTHPTVVLEQHQIFHHGTDVMSDTDEKMNDGIGRMSYALAAEIAYRLGLADTPSGFQGRFGSAKGMWIADRDDARDHYWIETYPSQRKWNCDFQDPHHRTFEVRGFSKDLRPALLNTQFIPILESQSRDKAVLRHAVANHLKHVLDRELDIRAIDHPTDLRSWMQQARMTGYDRLSGRNDHIPYIGGIPDKESDQVAALLDAGFDLKTRRVSDLVWCMGKKKADFLKTKLKIQVPCSTYAYMGVDFSGVLEPDEVHLSFSSKFQVEGFSDTLLEGMDVLVCRAPAHFPSDIQRVRVVSKPGLRKIKDMVVFPITGSRPLADLLSGGDYDGDVAWVCWDQSIVQNFVNAGVPPSFDFVAEGFLEKDKTCFQELLDRHGNLDNACAEFQHHGMSFNLRSTFLGICTKYKERLNYHSDPVSSEKSIVLSALLSNLVDQAKAGITFTADSWVRFRKVRLDRPLFLDETEYSKDKDFDILRRERKQNILDYLKFDVAEGLVDEALLQFKKTLDAMDPKPYDPDLTRLYNSFENSVGRHGENHSESLSPLKAHLDNEIHSLKDTWATTMSQRSETSGDFAEDVRSIYDQWVRISPPQDLKDTRIIREMKDLWTRMPISLSFSEVDPEVDDWTAPFSRWTLLKASATFKLCYERSYKFVWYVAGRQLNYMKAIIVSSDPSLADTAPAFMVPGMYAMMKPDRRVAQRMADRRLRDRGKESIAALDDVVDFDENGAAIDDV